MGHHDVVRAQPSSGDRIVAIGLVRSESTRIVKALARELLRALPDYAWSTSRGVDALVTALVLSFPPFS